MTGTVIEIQTALPQRHTCEDIQVRTGAALLKYRHRQIQVAAQNQREMLLHFIRQSAESDGTGDIRCTLPVLSAGIHQ